MFDFPFEDSRLENMFPPIFPADEIPPSRTKKPPTTSLVSPFPLHDSLYIITKGEQFRPFFDSSPENTGEQKNPENSVNSLRFENRGEKLKFISARMLGSNDWNSSDFISETNEFFRYFRQDGKG